ncbi:hypothetical protein BDD43_1025 [Mucilaginibacter gracilis]|uniref:Uncharacterized protein n=2 Tax=Mucilaginibacter gracilis TaxID=423350 RepID=A0A495IXU3_9SPHI|nr:hypothetical protein BDD43_1025 [Mucilaginibacter gracilis]
MAIVYTACKQKPAPVKPQPSFKLVHGISFTEVRRTFKSGVSFSDQGFQLEPDWKFTFLSDDSINIYSPEKKKFFNCPVIFDHDSIFNIAWAWMRVKKITKDSIKFQVLEVENKKIQYDRSFIYMTLYSDNYIKNVLHTDSATLVRPSRQDTLYIKHKAEMADADPKYAFGARIPASLTSNSPLVSVIKTSVTKSELENITTADDYLTPDFRVTIHKAYENFNYPIVILVDSKGVLHFSKSHNMQMPEFAESENRVMTAITNGYLKHYLNVKPGTTLGIAHASKIVVTVKGLKN